MTEQEWLTSSDPEAMAEAAKEYLRSDYPHGPRTERKRVLFSIGCCRLVWQWVAADARCLRLVEHLETRYDSPSSDVDEDELWRDVKDAARHPDDDTPLLQMLAADLVYDVGIPETVIGTLFRGFEGWKTPSERARLMAGLLRDIVGNPFRPVTFDPAWRTSDALILSQQMYESRDFGAMPILADALQEAGCEHPDILTHCRDASLTHVRGCWVVDLLLGKE